MKRFKLVNLHLLILFSLSVTLFCLGTAEGGTAAEAEKQSASETKVQRTEIQKRSIRLPTPTKKKKTSSRILDLRRSLLKNKEKTTKQTRDAVNLGIQTPELPKPFYADTHSEGSRHGLDFGVQTEDGSIYTLLMEEEVTEEGFSRRMGARAEIKLSTVNTFFNRTRDVLLYVPKKIGTGALYLGRGIKHLLWR